MNPRNTREKILCDGKYFTRTEKCWIWTRAKSRGYGHVSYNNKTKRAYRLIYEFLVGDIPKNMTLDHLCRNKACVNPEHLEPVTQKENVLRGVGPTAINAKKTHCIRGHEFNEQNTIFHPRTNYRTCRVCKNN